MCPCHSEGPWPSQDTALLMPILILVWHRGEHIVILHIVLDVTQSLRMLLFPGGLPVPALDVVQSVLTPQDLSWTLVPARSWWSFNTANNSRLQLQCAFLFVWRD